MNLSVAPSEARRSKRRLDKHQQLAADVEVMIGDILVATLDRELPAFTAALQGRD